MNEIEIKQKILSRCLPDINGCLIWQGSKTPDGYGNITIDGVLYYTHRIILKVKNGKWPKTTDHLCRNKSCQNEDHLEDVSYSENNRRMWKTAWRRPQKVCKRGHELTDENSIIRNGRRSCKKCKIILQRIRRASA